MEKTKNLPKLDQSLLMCSQVERMSRTWLFPLLLLLNDYIAIIAALFSVYFMREVLVGVDGKPLVFIPSTYMYVVIPLAFLLFLHYDKLYQKWLPFWQQTEKLFRACTYSMLLILVVLYATGSIADISRLFMFLSWLVTFIYLSVSRSIVQSLLIKCNFLQAPVIVFGAGKTLELMLAAFEKQQNMGYRIVGIIEDGLPAGSCYKGYPVLGGFGEAEVILQHAKVKDALITAPGLSREELISLVNRVQPFVDNVTFVPDLFGIPVQGMEVETLFHEKMVLLKVCNNLSNRYNLFIKRLFDLTASFCLLPLLLPIMACISLWLVFDSPGPILHKASRMGRGSKVFCCYKFRTMYEEHQEAFQEFLEENPDAKEEWETFAKIKGDDPRVTRAGAWLRRYSLDELPQILNVFLGDMSLVGPRPYLPRERHQMKDFRQVIHYARPGITGLWQVSGRNELSFEQRVRLDAWYVRNWSLWLDMVFLVRTIGVVLGRKGAY